MLAGEKGHLFSERWQLTLFQFFFFFFKDTYSINKIAALSEFLIYNFYLHARVAIVQKSQRLELYSSNEKGGGSLAVVQEKREQEKRKGEKKRWTHGREGGRWGRGKRKVQG